MMRRPPSLFVACLAGLAAGVLLALLFPPAPLPLAWASSITQPTVGFDPLSSTTLWMREEFGTGVESVTGTDASGTGGQLGWVFRLRGSAGSVTHQVGAWPNNGLYRITTGAAAVDDGFGLSFSGGGRQPFNNLGGNTNWGTAWIFRLGGTVSQRASFGVNESCTSAQVAQLGEGFRLRFDTAAADTNFTYEIIAAGASAGTAASSVAADTNFHVFRARSVVAGTWRFSIDGGAETTACAAGCDINGTISTANLTPCAFLVSAGAAGARTADVDAWFWQNNR